jgi:hypothetical protein
VRRRPICGRVSSPCCRSALVTRSRCMLASTHRPMPVTQPDGRVCDASAGGCGRPVTCSREEGSAAGSTVAA